MSSNCKLFVNFKVYKSRTGTAVSQVERMADQAGADLEVEFKARPRVKGEFNLDEGGQYVGEYVLLAGKKIREGEGNFVYADGSDYSGTWKNDKMEGKGRYSFAGGDSYEGRFLEGLFNGFGKYIFPDGSVYEGEWKDNVMHGSGCFLDRHKRRFEGEFLYGTFNSATAYITNASPDLPASKEALEQLNEMFLKSPEGDAVADDTAAVAASTADDE